MKLMAGVWWAAITVDVLFDC